VCVCVGVCVCVCGLAISAQKCSRRAQLTEATQQGSVQNMRSLGLLPLDQTPLIQRMLYWPPPDRQTSSSMMSYQSSGKKKKKKKKNSSSQNNKDALPSCTRPVH